jgi:hypothetical protein
VFEPFVDEVERARALSRSRPSASPGTPLELRVGALLLERAGARSRWSR